MEHQGGRPVSTWRSSVFRWMKQHRVLSVLGIAVFSFVFLVLIFHEAENFFFRTDETAKEFHEWFQFICGDWPNYGEDRFPRKSLKFASVLAIQFLLAVSPLGGVLYIFWWLATYDRRHFMRYIDVLHLRDSTLIDVFTKDVPEPNRTQVENQ